ncbi:hypothetical protein [Cupriavidus campinensis]|uniref:Transposase n=1 Tax=Cupriavidus campinensis TaxID=151783 RepID=A0ABY3EEB8_9BURK|nr:hypothetical protein [Cupriavidus campinensis]TSP09184.1 hypothetical protein FGG12_29000 [Cupriavidus campinensis]
MKVKIISVHGHGDYDKEYVYLQALEDADIGHYVLADSTYNSNGTISNKVRHTYWFPDGIVKKGSYISLWTKPGKNVVDTNSNGQTVHRYFWGLKEAVWNDDGDCAVLLEIGAWQLHRAKGK